MIESGYYPSGAEFDPNAPYNQMPDPDEMDFDVQVSMTIIKSTTVSDNNYYVEEGYDIEYDEDGYAHKVGGRSYNTENCDFKEDFSRQHIHPLVLLDEYKERLMEDKKRLEEEFEQTNNPKLKYKIRELADKIEDCDGWEWDDLQVEEE